MGTYFADGNVNFCTFMEGSLAKAEKNSCSFFAPVISILEIYSDDTLPKI